jgi:biotin carboxyl carrier protein
MAERTLIARLQPDPADAELLIISSPAVGIADGAPRVGRYLNPLDPVLTLRVLGRRHVVRLPRDCQGRIVAAEIPNRYTAVGYDQPLAHLDPRALTSGGEQHSAEASAAAGTGESGQGLLRVTAPSEGIFYRRPSPDAPPYVEVGAEVTAGAVLGLVEVMKCFNPITYGGPGLPERGRIVRVLGEDASEVQFDQLLFEIEPLS